MLAFLYKNKKLERFDIKSQGEKIEFLILKYG